MSKTYTRFRLSADDLVSDFMGLVDCSIHSLDELSEAVDAMFSTREGYNAYLDEVRA